MPHSQLPAAGEGTKVRRGKADRKHEGIVKSDGQRKDVGTMALRTGNALPFLSRMFRPAGRRFAAN